MARWGRLLAVMGMLALLVVTLAVLLSRDDSHLASPPSSQQPTEPVAQNTPDFVLRLRSATCSNTGENMLTVSGSVENISSQAFVDVGALATFTDPDSGEVARAFALLAERFEPASSHQFRLTAAHSATAKCTIQFVLPSGELLRTDESVVPD